MASKTKLYHTLKLIKDFFFFNYSLVNTNIPRDDKTYIRSFLQRAYVSSFSCPLVPVISNLNFNKIKKEKKGLNKN